MPLGLTGLGLLGWGPFASTGWFQRTQKTPGQASRVRAPFIEMELDHDTGAMRGTILAGRHQGARWIRSRLSTLLGLLPEFDADSRALLAAYLDRREPGWREHAQEGATAGTGRGPQRQNDRGGGLSDSWPCAGGERRRTSAGRTATLMKKLHPDQGGSTYLAAQINEAKEVLLRRHR